MIGFDLDQHQFNVAYDFPRIDDVNDDVGTLQQHWSCVDNLNFNY